MTLPLKIRYTNAEAKEFISNVTGDAVTISQVIDWGEQGLYLLYAPIKLANIRQVDKSDTVRITDSIVEIRPNNLQVDALGRWLSS